MTTFRIDPRQLARVREVAEDFMLDSIKVERPQGRSFNESTGIATTATQTLIYEGRARIAPTSPSVEEVGEELVSWRDADFYIPNDAPEVRVDDIITVTAADSGGVGRVWRVTAVRHATLQASRKVSAQSLAPSRTSDNINS